VAADGDGGNGGTGQCVMDGILWMVCGGGRVVFVGVGVESFHFSFFKHKHDHMVRAQPQGI
jgi:hypothetical protein